MTNTTVVHDTDSLLNLARLGDDSAWSELASRCAVPTFSAPDLAAAAASFAAPRSVGQHRYSHPGIGTWNGRTVVLTLGPGLASLAVTEEVRAERAVERVRQSSRRVITEACDNAMVLAVDDSDAVPSGRFVSEWSYKSRVRLRKAFAAVDWSSLDVPGAPLGMVTLTYPGDWLDVVPSGRVAKRHLKAFRQRYGRAVGRRLDGAWKLEFQGRGAPHFHILMPVPAMVGAETFEAWLACTWASIVKADNVTCARCGTLAACTDEAGGSACSTEYTRHRNAGTGLDFGTTARSSDPKRLGIYFLKHSDKTTDGKEYQHFVPREWLVNDDGVLSPETGPGRFWGLWGLKPATVAVELDKDDFVAAKRVMRKVAAARARAMVYQVARRQGASARAAVGLRRPKTTVLTSSRMVGGFVIVNDGVAFAGDLARAVNLARLRQ